MNVYLESIVRMLDDTCRGAFEAHYGVRVLDEAVEAAVSLSIRHLPGSRLPDTAESVLETACARIAIRQASTPPAIEDADRRIARLTVELAALEREGDADADSADRIEALAVERAIYELQLATLEDQWKHERELVDRAREIRVRLEAGDAEADSLRHELVALDADLATVQGEMPLLDTRVTGQAIAEVVTSWTSGSAVMGSGSGFPIPR